MRLHCANRIGHGVESLETPALVVDLGAFERNLDSMATILEQKSVSLRPHAKTHKSPLIAQLQIQHGAIGICCQTVSEAEHMVWGGVRDVMISNQVVQDSGIARLASLSKWARLSVCADDSSSIERLSAAAERFHTELGVLIEIEAGTRRAGVRSVQAALDLAQ